MSRAPQISSFERPPWVPARAVLVRNGGNNVSVWGEARVGDRLLGQVTWSPEGRLRYEKPFDAAGSPHGVETEYGDSGQIVWCARWVHGLMHGPAIQFDGQARPIVVIQFVRGRGADIWMNCGAVSEYRELAAGVPHGLERWGDPRRPWEEGRWSRGKRHGIFRRWSEDGALCKGFPSYYVNDAAVSRRAYEVARAEDGELPAYDARDDVNKRPMPPAVREAIDGAKRLRQEFALVERAREAMQRRQTI